MQLIPKEVLDIPRLGIVNVHPALLPKYRGRYSTAHAIFNGEKETGATLHFMDEGIDNGPIIMQKSFPIGKNDTAKTVYDTFTEVGTALFKRFVESLNRGEEIRSIPQDERKATYYPKSLPGGGKVDPSWDEETKKRFIRAMTFPPFPVPSLENEQSKEDN
jgi:methionyl-tRNA formyltransferase